MRCKLCKNEPEEMVCHCKCHAGEPAFYHCKVHNTMHLKGERLGCNSFHINKEAINMVDLDKEFKETGTFLSVGQLKEEKLELKNLTITKTEMKDLNEESKLCVSFKETTSVLVLNRVNRETLKEQYGAETDNWEGKKIKLVIMPVMFGEKKTEGIRVKV